MKKSINYWSFPGGLEGKKDIQECLYEAKEYGYEAVELAFFLDGPVSMTSTEEEIKRISKWAQDAGVDISSVATGLYWDYSLTSSDPSKVKIAKEVTVKMLEVASQLNADTVLVVPGAVDVFFNPKAEIVPYDLVYQRSFEALMELKPVAEKYKVNIGIENVWNKFLLSPLEMRNFVDSIGSDYVGVYFDVGNVIPFGYPEHWIRILGHRIKKVHFKDFRKVCGDDSGFVDLLEGDVNWPEVMAAFRAIGYDDYVVAEMIPNYTYCPDVRCKITAQAMDAILSL